LNEQMTVALARARLYQALADVFDSPLPEWLSEPSGDNPLADALVTAARELGSSACHRVIQQLASVPPQDLSMLRARHARLLVGPGLPVVSPYESWHRDAQMVGAASVEVGQWYEAMGAEVPAGELPDHVCMELAFLAYLYRQEAYALEQGLTEEAKVWHKQARRFLRKHPLKWLPQVGDVLAEKGGAVFGPLGYLVAAFIREEAGLTRGAGRATRKKKGFPSLLRSEACGLCGFCVQVCATRALYIHESAVDTKLMFNAERCTSCGACTKICPDDLLVMITEGADETVALRTSPRVICPSCGNVHVSEAEIEAVVARLEAIGPLRQSLMYCVDCKANRGATPKR